MTTRERMTREQMNELAFTVDSSGYLDIELPDDQVHEAVLLADALAYGADERAAAVIEGMQRSVRLVCAGCQSASQPLECRNGEWVHMFNGHLANHCSAGPIHDAIQRVSEQGERE